MKRLEPSKFYSELQKSSHGIEYLTLIGSISAEGRDLRKSSGFEIHHIHPRKLGGALSRENLIKVSTFEHCYLHALLARAIPCYETLQPIVLLSNSTVRTLSDLEQVSLEQLQQWSLLREQALHQPKPEAWHTAVIKANTGRIVSEETRQRMRNSHLGQKHKTNGGQIWVKRGEQEAMIASSDLDRYSLDGWVKGRLSKGKPSTRVYKHSLATKLKISEANKGRKRSEKSVFQQMQTRKERGLFARSQEARKKIGEANKGRIVIRNNGTVKMVRPEELPAFLDSGWIRGRK